MTRLVRLVVCGLAVTWATDAPAAEPWGTLSGRVVCDFYESPREIPRGGKDPLCKQEIFDESLLIRTEDGGLANVLVYVFAKPSRIHPQAFEGLPELIVVDRIDCRIVPHVAVVVLDRQKLLIKNTDTTSHNISGGPRGSLPFQMLLTDEPTEMKFTKPTERPFEMTCSVHPWEKAYCQVVDNPYFAITGPDGSFEIKNLPAGEELIVCIWHEWFGQIDANARTKKYKDCKFKLKPEEKLVWPKIVLSESSSSRDGS